LDASVGIWAVREPLKYNNETPLIPRNLAVFKYCLEDLGHVAW
jgi:hypothetical protein